MKKDAGHDQSRYPPVSSTKTKEVLQTHLSRQRTVFISESLQVWLRLDRIGEELRLRMSFDENGEQLVPTMVEAKDIAQNELAQLKAKLGLL